MDLSEINKKLVAIDDKPLRKANTLDPNSIYKIIGARVVKSRYGDAILIETAEFKMFLPNRMTKVLISYVDKLHEYSFKYIGETASSFGHPIVNIEILEDPK